MNFMAKEQPLNTTTKPVKDQWKMLGYRLTSKEKIRVRAFYMPRPKKKGKNLETYSMTSQ